MPNPKIVNMKKVMRTCIVAMVLLFLAGAIGLGIMFRNLNLNYDRQTELTALVQAGQTVDEKEFAAVAEAINSYRSSIINHAMVLAVFVIADAVVAFIFYRISLRQTKKQIYKIAYEDEITGLPTKAKHRTDVEEFLPKARGQYVYVSMEIDNFKYVNEMYGYSFGNYTLKYVATEISKELRNDELFARTGGAHFGLLLRYTSDEVLEGRLRGWFTKIGHMRNKDRGNVYNLQFTCGVYRIRDNHEDAGRARECANIARESARHLADNAIEFFNEELQKKQAARAELEFEMHSAFKDRQFEVYLQPKYSTADERIVGAEALIRWQHPTKGMIFPNDFIPLFESNGFIVKIDYFVLEEVCKCIRGWLDDDIEPVVVSVNLSRIHLYDSELVAKLVEIADNYRVPHELIEFELTETVLFEELEYLLEVMTKLKEAGFILSMDDFGSGYSSLNMLKRLPVDVLKLDKGFMDNFREDEPDNKDKTIISHVISMAKDLDMEVLAEGVESESQQKFLKETDCDMIQGYFYSKPMKLDQFDSE